MSEIVRALRKKIDKKIENKLSYVINSTKQYALRQLADAWNKPKTGVLISLQPDGTTRYNKSQRYRSGKIIRRSAAGETPAKITGRMAKSNNIDIYRTEKSVMIRLENTAPYSYLFDNKSRKHYFSTKKGKQWYTFKPRPYLSTVTDKVKNYMIKKFKEVNV